jgi:hypothetical protein
MESKMPNPTKIIINCETKEEQIIELTDEEVAEMEAAAAIAEEKRQEEEAAQVAKAAASASAVAKLEAIGLTAEEIAALRG